MQPVAPDSHASVAPPSWSDLLRIGGLGFASGLPLLLTLYTLQQWLSESGVSLKGVGAVGVIGLSYTLKFLWAPLLDRRPPPGFARLGRRRGWLLLSQCGVTVSILAMASGDPHSLSALIVAAIALSFCSATQDIAIDAWRIEHFTARQQSSALGGYVWGYRIAMLVARAGALALASRVGWHGSYGVMALLSLIGPLVCLTLPEPATVAIRDRSWVAALERSVVVPLRDLLSRPRIGWALAFVVLFNLGTQFADTMATSLYHALGYSRDQVAAANGIPNLIAVLAGATMAGVLVLRFGLARALVGCTLVQMCSLSTYFVVLAHHDGTGILMAKVLIEEFAESMAQTAFLSYLSLLCAREFAATQYALLSALATVGWRTLAGGSGLMATALGWTGFYLFSLACCVPALLLMFITLRRVAVPAGAPESI